MGQETEVGKRFPPTVLNFYAGEMMNTAQVVIRYVNDGCSRRGIEPAFMATA